MLKKLSHSDKFIWAVTMSFLKKRVGGFIQTFTAQIHLFRLTVTNQFQGKRVIVLHGRFTVSLVWERFNNNKKMKGGHLLLKDNNIRVQEEKEIARNLP